jgi:hypothetical protein
MSDTNKADVEKPKKRPKWVQSPKGIFETYANEVHFMWSLDDVRFRIGQLINSAETPNPGKGFEAVIEERAAITVSWRVAKSLRDQLSIIIDNYEKTNGQIKIDIKLPPGMD